jgi:hypothetical protein
MDRFIHMMAPEDEAIGKEDIETTIVRRVIENFHIIKSAFSNLIDWLPPLETALLFFEGPLDRFGWMTEKERADFLGLAVLTRIDLKDVLNVFDLGHIVDADSDTLAIQSGTQTLIRDHLMITKGPNFVLAPQTTKLILLGHLIEVVTFPYHNLTQLVINGVIPVTIFECFPNLIELSCDGIEDGLTEPFPSLQKLRVAYCSTSSQLWMFANLTHLEIDSHFVFEYDHVFPLLEYVSVARLKRYPESFGLLKHVAVYKCDGDVPSISLNNIYRRMGSELDITHYGEFKSNHNRQVTFQYLLTEKSIEIRKLNNTMRRTGGIIGNILSDFGGGLVDMLEYMRRGFDRESHMKENGYDESDGYEE